MKLNANEQFREIGRNSYTGEDIIDIRKEAARIATMRDEQEICAAAKVLANACRTNDLARIHEQKIEAVIEMIVDNTEKGDIITYASINDALWKEGYRDSYSITLAITNALKRLCKEGRLRIEKRASVETHRTWTGRISYSYRYVYVVL